VDLVGIIVTDSYSINLVKEEMENKIESIDVLKNNYRITGGIKQFQIFITITDYQRKV